MKNCKDCGNEISESAKVCPNCGAKQKGGAGKIILIVIIVIVVLGIIGAAGGGKSNTNSSTASSSSINTSASESSSVSESVDPYENDVAYQASNKKFVTVTDAEMTIEYGYPTVTGAIKAIDDNKSYSYVQIEFVFFDADGAQIGSTFTNITSLSAGATWKYEAMGFDEGAESFKISAITGY